MSYQSQIPNTLTSVRFIAAPIFFYTFLNDLFVASVFLLVLSLITDAFDGHVARKLNVTSDMGAYLDVAADFILILACFLAFIILGWYDPLILLLIIAMFLLFVGTSGLKKPVYDPIGKYLGGYLMIMVFISLLFPESLIRKILLIVLVIMCLISIISRFSVFYYRNNH
ncbi:CDP-alcohol phosphatidyltransferase family protein [Methanobacterium petrolearium]|uniref:CDP-alcohol phosphatidyltransferase family protein n=1 Tax=Methanobacterium petrolearium TaxID=710190 RepID=UPI001AE77A28